jgi:hypothetical protein
MPFPENSIYAEGVLSRKVKCNIQTSAPNFVVGLRKEMATVVCAIIVKNCLQTRELHKRKHSW